MNGRMMKDKINEQMSREHWWSATDRVTLHYMETRPSVTVSTGKPMWTGLRLNLGL
jgi:hypothetical protein